jgi:hypothetical protein
VVSLPVEEVPPSLGLEVAVLRTALRALSVVRLVPGTVLLRSRMVAVGARPVAAVGVAMVVGVAVVLRPLVVRPRPVAAVVVLPGLGTGPLASATR